MTGMSATTGRRLDDATHIRQSVRDILHTPIGTRVMRREYGSLLFALVDAPMDRVTVLDIIQATAGAIGRWEPRVAVQRVAVEEAQPGRVTINLDLLVRATGAPIRMLGTPLAPPPIEEDVTLRETTTDAIRVDAVGRLRRALVADADQPDINDVGAALAYLGEQDGIVAVGTLDALAGAAPATTAYYLADDALSLTVRIPEDLITDGTPLPYESAVITFSDGAT